MTDMCLICDAMDAPLRRAYYLLFRCISCERNHNDTHQCIVWHVPGGRYPAIQFTNGRFAIVLPFDAGNFGGHLLHDVRAEWDRQFICSRNPSVQERLANITETGQFFDIEASR